MSRLIKKPIAVGSGATLTFQDGVLAVKGPKGELTVNVPKGLTVTIGEGTVLIGGAAEENPAMAGTVWSLTQNAIKGVLEGFTKVLEVEGVGYRVAVEGKELVLFLGYALPVRMAILDGVTVTVEKNVIKVSGISKELVGRMAAEIRAKKKPEPYKGKGIHYQGEVIRRKVGKKAGAGAAAA